MLNDYDFLQAKSHAVQAYRELAAVEAMAEEKKLALTIAELKVEVARRKLEALRARHLR